MLKIARLFLLAAWATNGCSQEFPHISTVAPDLEIPALLERGPAPGLRVKQVHPDFADSGVYHSLYLPADWTPEKKWPVIIDLPGNGNFRNAHGDTSSGLPEQCMLGYGLSRGKGAIWAALPFLTGDGKNIAKTWWGDPPDYNPGPSISYIKTMVPWICDTYHGDPDKVILAGFSRGAIACNFIGLHDDEIAGLWRGMFIYSHYDGVRKWPFPKSDRASALERLQRLGNRPQFLCQEGSGVEATASHLAAAGVKGNFTFAPTGFLNHNAAWLLRPSPARTRAWQWYDAIVK